MELVTSDMASGGDAVARDSAGKAVFVRGALPGERVRVTLVADHSSYAVGCIDELLEPSPHRRAPPCPELGRGCGACQWQHIDLPVQRLLKERFVVEAIRRSGVQCPAPWAFRTTIDAAVKDGRAGFHRARSHQIVPVDSCLVAHPLLGQLLVDVRYPGARSVLLRCGARTGERLVRTTPSGLRLNLPGGVRVDHFHESAAGRLWRVSPRSFFQSRADGADALAAIVGAAADEMGTPSTAIDLYSGVGLFAGVLATRGWSVTAVEGSQSAADDATFNLRHLSAAAGGSRGRRPESTRIGTSERRGGGGDRCAPGDTGQLRRSQSRTRCGPAPRCGLRAQRRDPRGSLPSHVPRGGGHGL